MLGESLLLKTVILCISIFFVTTVNLPAGSYGYDDNGFVINHTSDTFRLDASNKLIAYRFHCPGNSVLDKVHVYLKYPSAELRYYKLTLYNDNAGVPYTLVCSTDFAAGADTGNNKWFIVDLPNTALTSGAVYHVVISTTIENAPYEVNSSTYIIPYATYPNNNSIPSSGETDYSLNVLGYGFGNTQAWMVLDLQPVFILEFTDGVFWGNPYAYATQSNTSMSTGYQISGATQTGNSFTINSSTMEFTGFSVYLRKSGIPVDILYYDLRGPDNYSILIESGPVTAASEVATAFSWITQKFYYGRVFCKDRKYFLTLKSPGSYGTGNAYTLNVLTNNSGSTSVTNRYNTSTYGGTLGGTFVKYIESTQVLTETGTAYQRDVAFRLITDDHPPSVNFEVLDLVINEVAWMGTDANYRHEWVELYNNTTNQVTLTGWKFCSNTSTITLTGTISAGGYYLIEDTEPATSVTADIVAGVSLSNNPFGEKLVLYSPAGNVVDTVNCECVSWYGGNNTVPKQSMERVNTRVPGDISSNWASNNKKYFNSADADGNTIYATPKSTNSVSYPPEVVIPEPGLTGYELRINEFAVEQTSSDGYDWVEIYNPAENGINLYGLEFYELAYSSYVYLEKFEGDWTLPATSYLVLRFNYPRNMSNPMFVDGYYEIYTDKNGLSSGDNCLFLKSNTGQLLDFVAWANMNGVLTNKTSFQSVYNLAVSTGQWHGLKTIDEAVIESWVVNYKYGSRNTALSRDADSTDGTNPSKTEWHLSKTPTPGLPTRGKKNRIPDTTAPSKITDLHCRKGDNRGTVKIKWTAVGDDGTVNTASGYVVRYATYMIVTSADIEKANNCYNASVDNTANDIFWLPKGSGETESYEIGGLQPGVTYFVAVVTEDEQPNYAVISNTVSAVAADIAGSNIRINEIVPLSSDGKDWVELYNASISTVNLSGWKLYGIKSGSESQSIIKTFPEISIAAGEYIVAHLEQADLRGFEGVVILRDNGGNLVDFVAYSQGIKPFWDNIWDDAMFYHQWSGADKSVVYAADWAGGNTEKSLGRSITSSDTDDVGIAKTDWRVYAIPTKGKQNDGIAPGQVTDLEVIVSSSVGDGMAYLTWTAPGDDGTFGSVTNGKYELYGSTISLSAFGNYSAWWGFISSSAVGISISTGIVTERYGITFSTVSVEHIKVEVVISTTVRYGVKLGVEISGLIPGDTYYWALKTYDDIGNSSFDTRFVLNISTLQVCGFTGNTVPLKPQWVFSHPFTRSTGTIMLAWSPNTELDILGYKVFMSTSIDSGYDEVITLYNGTTGFVKGVDDTKTYYFKLYVQDITGYMMGSDVLTVSSDVSMPVLTHTVISEINMFYNKIKFVYSADDNNGVLFVTLVYFLDGETAVTHTHTYGNAVNCTGIKEFEINGVSHKTELYYYIAVYDTAGNAVASTGDTVIAGNVLNVSSPHKIVVSDTVNTLPGSTGEVILRDGNCSDGETKIVVTAETDKYTSYSITTKNTDEVPSSRNTGTIDTSVNAGIPVIAYEFGPGDKVFSQPATLTLLYLDNDDDGKPESINGNELEINESQLRVFYWTGTQWGIIGGVVDSRMNVITVKVGALGTYSVFPFNTQ
ncbi:MAG: lamin tail domain-containing protein, partial [Elusimicrobiota bacterium]